MVSCSFFALCVYIPAQLSNFVQKKTLAILHENQEPNTRKIHCDDIEYKSTVVVVTNIPDDLHEHDLDDILRRFGRTLTKVTKE